MSTVYQYFLIELAGLSSEILPGPLLSNKGFPAFPAKCQIYKKSKKSFCKKTKIGK